MLGRALDQHRLLRRPDQLRAEPLVRADPGVEVRAVGSPPARVLLDRAQRVAVLERRPHRRDEAAERGSEAAHVLEHRDRQPTSLLLGRDEDRERTHAIGIAVALERSEKRVAPVGGLSDDRDAVALGHHLVAVDEHELEVGEIGVETVPVAVRDRVVEQDLRPDPLEPLFRLGCRNDLHRRSSRATACAASPSPRPVKPRWSVVVARTFTSPSPIAPARRRRISSRRPAMRASSPTRTQSALTSLHPAARTCPYASVRSVSDETPRKRSSPEGNSDPMSPSPAAPSTASMSAWASTSPSECPASPRGCSSSTPPRTSGMPSSRACASTPMPTRTSAIEEAFHAREVGGRRHLQQALVAADDLHPPARRLDERGAIRRPRPVVTCREGSAQH